MLAHGDPNGRIQRVKPESQLQASKDLEAPVELYGTLRRSSPEYRIGL